MKEVIKHEVNRRFGVERTEVKAGSQIVWLDEKSGSMHLRKL